MSSHLTMQQLEDLGFELIKSYTHDNFVTQRRVKKVLEVETTYRMSSGIFVSQELFIKESYMKDFTANELKLLIETLL